MRTSISKSVIAGLAGLSLTASVFAWAEPAAASYEYHWNPRQAGSHENSVSSRPTSAERGLKLAERDLECSVGGYSDPDYGQGLAIYCW
jgi:hypothetical protein